MSEPSQAEAGWQGGVSGLAEARAGGVVVPVTVIVPCFNEEAALPYLCQSLLRMRAALAERYELRFLFVDDGSDDGTWAQLRRTFQDWPSSTFVRHPYNRGLTAAIFTGAQHADTEVVCSIDSDCTYDPCDLGNMIPLLMDGVDLVTASPYHPAGKVENVPAWRLWLSKLASRMYRCILNHKLATYTSCFRVYRRDALRGVTVTFAGFPGVAETLARLDLQGSGIVEYPTTLTVRKYGYSKIKIVRVIAGHLRLLAYLLGVRLWRALGLRRSPGLPATAPIARTLVSPSAMNTPRG
jgi:glycosyltransferase involved in cell wall biosynthesis